MPIAFEFDDLDLREERAHDRPLNVMPTGASNGCERTATCTMGCCTDGC